jgi:hypothetical protein
MKQSQETLHLLIFMGIVLSIILVSGCATKAQTEFIDADGTSFKATAKAGPFGKLDTTNQHLAYRWNATDGTIEVGSEAQGLDNSGQIEAAQVAGQLVTSIVASLASAGLFTPKIDVVTPDTSPLDRLASLCELLCRVPAGIVDGSPMLSQSRSLCGCE